MWMIILYILAAIGGFVALFFYWMWVGVWLVCVGGPNERRT